MSVSWTIQEAMDYHKLRKLDGYRAPWMDNQSYRYTQHLRTQRIEELETKHPTIRADYDAFMKKLGDKE